MSLATHAPERPALTADHLLDAPLPQLLAEFAVDVVTSRITDPTFTGGAAVRPDGSLLFAKPAGRSAAEWDMLARAMLGQALRVPMPELPAPYRITEP